MFLTVKETKALSIGAGEHLVGSLLFLFSILLVIRYVFCSLPVAAERGCPLILR